VGRKAVSDDDDRNDDRKDREHGERLPAGVPPVDGKTDPGNHDPADATDVLRVDGSEVVRSIGVSPGDVHAVDDLRDPVGDDPSLLLVGDDRGEVVEDAGLRRRGHDQIAGFERR
jgi:hypothetical protein